MKESTRDFKKLSQNMCFHCSKKKDSVQEMRPRYFRQRQQNAQLLWTRTIQNFPGWDEIPKFEERLIKISINIHGYYTIYLCGW